MFRVITNSRLKRLNESLKTANHFANEMEKQRDEALKWLDKCQQQQTMQLHKLEQVQKTNKSRLAKINKQKEFIYSLKVKLNKLCP